MLAWTTLILSQVRGPTGFYTKHPSSNRGKNKEVARLFCKQAVCFAFWERYNPHWYNPTLSLPIDNMPGLLCQVSEESKDQGR